MISGVRLFKDFKNPRLLKFIAVIALSDGSIESYKDYKKELRLGTHKDSTQQHELLNYLSNRIIGKNIAQYQYKDMLSSRVYSKKLITALYNLSPEYKTTPTKETKAEFLSKPQPTLKFILNESKKVQMLAFRMWFDFEGSMISRFRLAKKIDKGYLYYDIAFSYEIFLAETNPSLVNDLVELSSNLGFKALIMKSKRNWSGIEGIRIYRKRDVSKFAKIGPITNVKVSKKSPKLAGFKKRSICLATDHVLKWKKIHWSFKDLLPASGLKQELDKKWIKTIKKYDLA
ncbi:hypothetical protein FJZ53_00675 [Candidatus Woesearchaeota archaeon]|nr:hypothetical protein [Candidatus Woesearchaeota archaeon]